MTQATAQNRLSVPYQNAMTDKNSMVTSPWQSFFNTVYRCLEPLGFEKSFSIANNNGTATNIDGLSFNYQKRSMAAIEYLIQRVTTGPGAVELIETNLIHVVYKPNSNTWVIVPIGSPGPNSSGVSLSITSAGQLQYTSSNVTGTAWISKITWRARYLAAKNSQYSTVGT